MRINLAEYRHMSHEVLLYYLYTPIDDAEALRDSQRSLCEALSLKGRIIVAKEGINGTVEGTAENCQAYIDAVHADSRFTAMSFKRSQGTGNAFPKLSVKVRPELVAGHLGEMDVNPIECTGKRLSAEQLQQWITEKREFYIIDMRNEYEHAAGYFLGSILPSLENFRDLPRILPSLTHLQDKTILTVCTGGVRCEKASGFLLKHGFTDVYQLDGGIVSYMERYPNQHFLGKLYVFDGRITMGFNTDAPEHTVVGKCAHCGTSNDRYVNCGNDLCHKHFICCSGCESENGVCYCSTACENEVKLALVASAT